MDEHGQLPQDAYGVDLRPPRSGGWGNVRSLASWSTRSPSPSTSPDPFAVLPRRCFCMVLRPDGTGHTMPCPERVAVQGTYADGSGMAWNVYSCRTHAPALGDPRPIAGVERDRWRT